LVCSILNGKDAKPLKVTYFVLPLATLRPGREGRMMTLVQGFHRPVVMERKTILLIQFAETQGNGTKRHLEARGYEVIWAGSGVTALMMAAKKTVDLIILDVALLDIEGLDLCHQFRKQKDTHFTPIILLTAYGNLPNRIIGSANGPDAYLAKPYRESELDERIVTVFKNSAQIEQDVEPLSSPTQKLEPVPKVAVEQLTLKPDLKLIFKAEKFTPRLADQSSAGSPVTTLPEKFRERRPVLNLNTVSRPRLVVSSAAVSDPEPTKKSQMSTISVQQNEEGRERGLILTANQELNLANATVESSPILAFRVRGDAVIDPTTGLFGRPQFEVMFSKEFKRAVRFKQQMSCMLINLDGHNLGRKADEALVKAIISLVQKTIREVDTAAWWSGESFIVLLPNTIRTDAMQAAARTLEVVATHPFTWPDATQVTMSIGIAGLPDKNIDSEQKMIEVAEIACKRAQEFAVPPSIDVHSLRR
jgi:diguanylate cyclase (GGDEF)-like protein